MAAGGDDYRRWERENHPLRPRFGQREIERQLSRDDIGNQARYLLTQFIHDRLEENGMRDAPAAEVLIDPGTPTGPPLENVREVAQALRRIGDELDGDESLQHLISQIPPDASQSTFQRVARVIFSDGTFNWGRVVALFYFAYKMVAKAVMDVGSQVINIMRSIIEWVIGFIVDFVAPWIIERGGWESIREYFGTPDRQLMGIFITGICLSVAFYLWKRS